MLRSRRALTVLVCLQPTSTKQRRADLESNPKLKSQIFQEMNLNHLAQSQIPILLQIPNLSQSNQLSNRTEDCLNRGTGGASAMVFSVGGVGLMSGHAQDENADAGQAIFEPPPENWRRPHIKVHDDQSLLDLEIHEAGWRYGAESASLETDVCAQRYVLAAVHACYHCNWHALGRYVRTDRSPQPFTIPLRLLGPAVHPIRRIYTIWLGSSNCERTQTWAKFGF